MKEDLSFKIIPASEMPLSSDVVIIEGNDYTWVYDVGASFEALNELVSVNKPMNIVISHFHEDHTKNIKELIENGIKINRLFIGNETYKFFNKYKLLEGCDPAIINIVGEQLFIEDGHLKLLIFPVPSSHAKGCLGLMLNDEYAFLGDSTYAFWKNEKKMFNAGLLQAEIALLKSLPAKYLGLSHERKFLYKRELIIRHLENIYRHRQANDPYICVY